VHTSNPVRIDRIGSDRIQVFIRPVLGDADLVAVTDRIEQLLDAGYDTIDVVFDEEPHQTTQLT
jgi:hypothetical protein